MHRMDSEGGFNYLELMVVVAIIGIITSIAIATYVFSITNSRRIACKANQRILFQAATVYTADEGSPPADIEDLRPFATTFDTAITCTSDSTVQLVWDADEEEIVCPLHP